jgi:hypothetical protein
MPLRRLEDRIRHLCGKAVSVQESDDLSAILTELKSALQEHTQRLRALAAIGVRSPREFPFEKRKATG